MPDPVLILLLGILLPFTRWLRRHGGADKIVEGIARSDAERYGVPVDKAYRKVVRELPWMFGFILTLFFGISWGAGEFLNWLFELPVWVGGTPMGWLLFFGITED